MNKITSLLTLCALSLCSMHNAHSTFSFSKGLTTTIFSKKDTQQDSVSNNNQENRVVLAVALAVAACVPPALLIAKWYAKHDLPEHFSMRDARQLMSMTKKTLIDNNSNLTSARLAYYTDGSSKIIDRDVITGQSLQGQIG